MNPFYVLSTGRAGSTYLARNLESVLPVEVNLHQISGSRLTSILSNVDLAFKTKLAGLSLPDATVDPQQSVHIYNGLAAHLRQDLKVIVLLRDPRDFVTSMMNWKNRRLQSKVSHHLIPFWSPVPAMHGTSWLNYAFMSKFEHFAWTWNFKNRLFLSLRDMGYDVMVIKTEDMIGNVEAFNQLLEFIGLDKKSESLSGIKNASEKRYFPHWKHWSGKEREILREHCEPLMTEFGYGSEPEWKNR